MGFSPQPELLACYNHVDIALDTFPYNGGATTCEALWMGVPVITLAGSTHASRVGVSILNGCGVPEFIAENSEDYCLIAAALAQDLPRLRQLRDGLRQRLQESPLMDGEKFVYQMQQAFRAMWQGWCDGAARKEQLPA